MTKFRHFPWGLATLPMLSPETSTSFIALLSASTPAIPLTIKKPITCSPHPQLPCAEAL
jgi:hypothetical protein